MLSEQNTELDINIDKFYTESICNWIINESVSYAEKNGGWTTSRHKNYPTTDLPVENMKKIFSYILSNFEFEIIKKIKQSYCLDDNITFDITNNTSNNAINNITSRLVQSILQRNHSDDDSFIFDPSNNILFYETILRPNNRNNRY